MKTEKQVQNEILSEFGSKPWCRLWRQNTGTAVPIWAVKEGSKVLPRITFGVPGCADLSGILEDGTRLEIEVKKPGGRQSEKQRNFQRMINDMDGMYILATCVQDVYDELFHSGYTYE